MKKQYYSIMIAAVTVVVIVCFSFFSKQPYVPQEQQEQPYTVVQDCPSQVPSININRMDSLFNPHSKTLLPVIETVTFVSAVPWVQGREAYIADYARYHHTSTYFIARSLHGQGGDLTYHVSKGDRFNVFKQDAAIEFHLVADLSLLRMWVYYVELNTEQRVLLGSYPFCGGKHDVTQLSGSLTPTGVYRLGQHIAIYKPGDQGVWKNQMCEMVTIFGVRWIPFEQEIRACTAPAKGLGIHGVSYHYNAEKLQYVEESSCIGTYTSNGCIRLKTEDVVELFALVSSKPSYIHIVSSFDDAKLPGKEAEIES